jgi:hypothetical protein
MRDGLICDRINDTESERIAPTAGTFRMISMSVFLRLIVFKQVERSDNSP